MFWHYATRCIYPAEDSLLPAAHPGSLPVISALFCTSLACRLSRACLLWCLVSTCCAQLRVNPAHCAAPAVRHGHFEHPLKFCLSSWKAFPTQAGRVPCLCLMLIYSQHSVCAYGILKGMQSCSLLGISNAEIASVQMAASTGGCESGQGMLAQGAS